MSYLTGMGYKENIAAEIMFPDLCNLALKGSNDITCWYLINLHKSLDLFCLLLDDAAPCVCSPSQGIKAPEAKQRLL